MSKKLKRVAAICGDDFIQNALQIDWKHDDFFIYPAGSRYHTLTAHKMI